MKQISPPIQLPRGCQARYERHSISIRQQLGIPLTAHCPACAVAGLYGITVTGNASLIDFARQGICNEFPDPKLVCERLSWAYDDSCSFSAMLVVCNLGGIPLPMVLHNDQHPPARRESNLMHELAHFLCGHLGNALEPASEIGFRQYDRRYELEAERLGATLQVPEDGLFQLARDGRTNEEIASIYKASTQMVGFRRNILGIDRRLGYLRR